MATRSRSKAQLAGRISVRRSSTFLRLGPRRWSGARDLVTHIPPQAVRLGLEAPRFISRPSRKKTGRSRSSTRAFHYPKPTRAQDLTCSVIRRLATSSTCSPTTPTSASTIRKPARRAPDRSVVARTAAQSPASAPTQRNLAGYCTQGRFQWQFMQPVYVGRQPDAGISAGGYRQAIDHDRPRLHASARRAHLQRQDSAL